MGKYFGAFVLSAALLTPLAAVKAADHDRDDRNRYYDSYKHDWHEWNENENRAYRRYLEDRREQYHDWSRSNKREQRDYWRWRHAHPDDRLWNERDRDDRDRH